MTADIIIQNIEALLSINIKMAERVGNDNLNLITVARAKTIMQDILEYKKEKSKSKSKHIKKEPVWLDRPE